MYGDLLIVFSEDCKWNAKKSLSLADIDIVISVKECMQSGKLLEIVSKCSKVGESCGNFRKWCTCKHILDLAFFPRGSLVILSVHGPSLNISELTH